MEIDMNAYDPIVEEIYAIRRKISERYGHSIRRYIEAMRTKQREEEAAGIVHNYVRPGPQMHMALVRLANLVLVVWRVGDNFGTGRAWSRIVV